MRTNGVFVVLHKKQGRGDAYVFPSECWWGVRLYVYSIWCVCLRGVSWSGVAAPMWAEALCKEEAMWNQALLIGNESLYHGLSLRRNPDIIALFPVSTCSPEPRSLGDRQSFTHAKSEGLTGWLLPLIIRIIHKAVLILSAHSCSWATLILCK